VNFPASTFAEAAVHMPGPVFAAMDGAQFDDLPALLKGAGLARRSLFLGHADKKLKKSDLGSSDGRLAEQLVSPPDQNTHMDLGDFHSALKILPAEHREVVILIGASGFSSEEVAVNFKCRAGTIKSHVSSARERLRSFSR
jgi:DNA-directed RNA polymerase specialized sigma24 family protein